MIFLSLERGQSTRYFFFFLDREAFRCLEDLNEFCRAIVAFVVSIFFGDADNVDSKLLNL